MLWRMDSDSNEGCWRSEDQVVRVCILRFLRLREELRVKVLVVKGVMDGIELRL